MPVSSSWCDPAGSRLLIRYPAYPAKSKGIARCVPQLSDVGDGVAHVVGEKLLVGCGERDLLEPDSNPGMLALELGYQRLDGLPLPPEG
jgi:hypothetical protein